MPWVEMMIAAMRAVEPGLPSEEAMMKAVVAEMKSGDTMIVKLEKIGADIVEYAPLIAEAYYHVPATVTSHPPAGN
jgi:hypothetical protein